MRLLSAFLLLTIIQTTTLRADWESILKNANQSGRGDSSSNESPKSKPKISSKTTATSEKSRSDIYQNQVESFPPKYKVPTTYSAQPSSADASQISLRPNQPKEALLIANGDYAHFGKLPNPIKDARLLVRSLQQIGFKVTLLENASKESMLEAFQSFQDSLKGSHAVALFHYGGHGVQVDGRNYLIPADADIPDERKVTTRAVDLDEVMTTLDASSSYANVVILDACRDNPLPSTTSRSATRGLTVVQSKPKNSLVIFAAEAGSRAVDGLFTPTLASAILEPTKSLSQITKDVRREVFKMSNGTQTPGDYDQLFEDIYLYSQPNTQPSSSPSLSSSTTVLEDAVEVNNSSAGVTNTSTP